MDQSHDNVGTMGSKLNYSRRALDLGFFLMSCLMASSRAAECRELGKQANGLLRFFDMPKVLELPDDTDKYTEYLHAFLQDRTFIEDCYEILRLHHGGKVAGHLYLGYALPTYALAVHENSEESQKAVGFFEANVRANAKAAGISQSAVEQFVVNPTPENLQLLFEAKSGKVFIVHGHNHEVRNEINIFLRDLDLQTVVMDAEANLGKTLPEKFESIADECSFAVFIVSADDHLRDYKGKKTIRRARQNVILEIGYFWGTLGRDSSCAFLVEDVDGMELPSDLQGVGWIPITSDLAQTKLGLRRELEAADLL